jgi:hypothetical protein
LELASPASAEDFSSFFSGNGSFEFGEYAPPLIFPNVQTLGPNRSYSTKVVTGWSLFGYNTRPRWLEGPDAQDGTRYIGLSASFNSGGTDSGLAIDGHSISHTPFTPGEIYELSFWAAGGAGSNNYFSVSLSSSIQTSFDLPDYTTEQWNKLSGLEWKQFVIPFTADNPSFYFSISPNKGPSRGLTSSIYLDNFSIVPIPEPGSALLTIFAGTVLMMTRHRRYD